MRLQVVLRYAGFVLLLNALFLLISALISAMNSEPSILPLFYSSIITLLFGLFPLIFVPAPKHITNNEGMVIVTTSWLICCLVGTLPYILWGGEFSLSNAWFESVSGYTTTGSTILENIEALPLGLLFWRASTHWIGGMGIIIFALSVLPSMGNVAMTLYRSEMSPLARDNFRSNVASTLKIVLSVYVGLTALETIALMFCGMNLFDAVTHAFGTIATGGFSTKNASIASYDSVTIENVIMVFMLLSGIHFGILFTSIFQNIRAIWQSSAVKYYVAVLMVGVGIATVNLHSYDFPSWGQALRYASFQILSVGTSTGFASADSSVWPALAQVLLIFFSLQCACAGSTSGGIKTDRFVLLGKAIRKQIRILQHPHAVIPLKLDGKNIADDVLAMGILYICVYLLVVFVTSLLLIALGVDPLAAFSGSVATTGNVGPGLASVGSLGNFNHIPNLGKWILSISMLLGRLEIYGVLIFFLPGLWQGKYRRPPVEQRPITAKAGLNAATKM